MARFLDVSQYMISLIHSILHNHVHLLKSRNSKNSLFLIHNKLSCRDAGFQDLLVADCIAPMWHLEYYYQSKYQNDFHHKYLLKYQHEHYLKLFLK